MPGTDLRLRTASGLARATRIASRRAGKGGTTVAGRLLLRLAPDALRQLSRKLDQGSVLVSATNGKTTTSAMLAAILGQARVPLVHNRAGSNMHWGVATALLDAGRGDRELGLFEVDEAWLPAVADAVNPRLVLLSNLFRDQLDRYGELELLAERWAQTVAAHARHTRFALNADDPLVADLGRGIDNDVYFGLEDDAQALPELQHAADSKHCRNCGHAYVYDAVYLGHLGRYHCPSCGRRRPEPQVVARNVALHGMGGSAIALETPAGNTQIELKLPGLYNVYNALAAATAALELGATLEDVRAGLEGFGGAFGRVERIPVDGREVLILLVKNPAGANEVLRTLTLEDGRLDLWLALNDRIADGRDVSWIWDADFELLAGRVATVTCSGTRAEEMALRLKYAGIDAKPEVDRELARALDAAVARGERSRPLYALPTYTALLELRDELAERGVAGRWSA
ncbi:MAG TPA: MurT ligase domain-containing protein [Thermoleophilaceae bacterium]|nr:MurT ligase domain-containing protein [Thermoleophilaceae bacterium]